MSKLLTPLELKVMNILWQLKKAFVKELIEEWPEKSKPAYNTISTTIRILEEKEYVKHKAFGRTHQYYPAVSKQAYQKRLIGSVLDNAFSGSVSSLVSALVGNSKMDSNELNDLQDLIDQHKK